MLIQHKNVGFMCGIIGVTSLSDIQDHILSSLKRLEYRGYDSSGIATISNSKLNFFICFGLRLLNINTQSMIK